MNIMFCKDGYYIMEAMGQKQWVPTIQGVIVELESRFDSPDVITVDQARINMDKAMKRKRCIS
jgi:hypothetical protein